MNAITLGFMRAGNADACKKFLNATEKYSSWNLSASYRTYQQLKHQGVVK